MNKPTIKDLKESCLWVLNETGLGVGSPHVQHAKITLAALAHYEAMQPDESGLRPCPFCGGNVEVDNLGGKNDWFVECEKCRVGQHAYHTEVSAIKAWNTRPDPVLEAVAKVLEGE